MSFWERKKNPKLKVFQWLTQASKATFLWGLVKTLQDSELVADI